jgi:hypothetical protein
VVHVILLREGSGFQAILLYQFRQNFRSPADMKQIFSGRTTFELRTQRAAFRLAPLENWVHLPDGYRTALDVPGAALQAIAQEPSFELDADWENVIQDVNPSASFGIEGFRNAIVALIGQ